MRTHEWERMSALNEKCNKRDSLFSERLSLLSILVRASQKPESLGEALKARPL
jgi:hypothetical protein